ncbi:hypothetical protein EDB80DRAFT_124728 [Ilyonectria destructans]|nr:hypothetical protein EDB80DRAFT_124728 [Ilyonectria destructans]
MLRALSPGRQAAGYHGPPPKVPRACGMLECGQGHNLAWQNNALGYDTAWHGLDPSRRAWKRADPPSRFCRKLADQNGQGEPPLSSTGFDLYFVGKARRRACTLSQFPLTILGAKTTRCLVPSPPSLPKSYILHALLLPRGLHCPGRSQWILPFPLGGGEETQRRGGGGGVGLGSGLWALVLASQRLFSTLRRRTSGFVCVRPSFSFASFLQSRYPIPRPSLTGTHSAAAKCQMPTPSGQRWAKDGPPRGLPRARPWVRSVSPGSPIMALLPLRRGPCREAVTDTSR